MTEASFYQKLDHNKVKCELCHQFCQINDGKRGLCGVRQNQNGILQSLVYGKVIAAHPDPIEKKPLYHFLPGTQSFSVATVGCNFRCAHCQNADISQATKQGPDFIKQEITGTDASPEQIVAQAKTTGCQSIAYTYTEPTIFFEFAFDCMKLASQKGLKNVWVSNGYTNTPPLEKAKPYLQAVNIDLKFFKDKTYQKICGAKLQPVLDNLVWYKQNGIWLEVTTLIIPTLNDSDEELSGIAKFIKDKLGAETPWHVSAFFPTYKLLELPPTPTATVIKAWRIGKAVGLKHVYGGNVMNKEVSDSHCSNCGEPVIERIGYQIKRLDKNGKCQKCGNGIEGVLNQN